MGKAAEECNVQVVVRCRPLNEKEVEFGHTQCVKVLPKRCSIEIRKPNQPATEPGKMFTFDSVYDCNSTQNELYEETFAPIISSVLDGFNGTIFAYGQTGTGKTYTMEGGPKKDDEESRGAIPRAFDHIFSHIAITNDEQYLVRASYLEIYQEEIRDLLSKNPNVRLDLKERPDTGVYVKDLATVVCKSKSEIEHVMKVGNQNRKVGPTNMNEHSSRSHAIFIITIECSKDVEISDNDNNKSSKSHIRAGKLNLVDLAGSERQAKTGATGERLKEATKINLSLAALGNVISALVDGKSTHIPYRDSKLTRLLQDSLGGNAKTIMVANIGPADYNYEESLTTLRYANRAKNIKNKPRINEDPKDALLREFQEEIARLKAQLGNKGGEKRKKKRKRNNEDNKEGSDESVVSSPEPPDDETNHLQARLEVERDLIESDKNMLTEEKDKLLKELNSKETMLKKQREEQSLMKNKIKALESKLLSGNNTNMVERTNEQQRLLEKQRAEIAEKKKAEREAAKLLEEQEEQGLELERTYSSLQHEVDSKTKRLRKLFAKLQSVKQEITDVTDEYNRDRRDLEETQQELLKDLKLKYMMIDNFIPPKEKQKILDRAQYDENEDTWYLVNPGQTSENTITKRPVSAAGSRRPMSEYARMLGNVENMGGRKGSRFRGENIMRLNLDRPGRTTRDYKGPDVAPRVQAALDAALMNVEPDIDIDVGSLSTTNNKMVKGRRKSAKRKEFLANEDVDDVERRKMYPASRGLVPK